MEAELFDIQYQEIAGGLNVKVLQNLNKEIRLEYWQKLND